MVPFWGDFESVETWLRLHEHEPIRSILDYSLSVDLESDAACHLKNAYRAGHPRSDVEEHVGCQNPADRVQQSLEFAETKDPGFFFNLCRDMTLTVGATHYGFDRFLTRTPGWETATPDIRARIVEAARRILIAPTDEPEQCRSAPLNSILCGHMVAVWLLLEVDPDWLDRRPGEWWDRWSWYLLRGLQLTLSGEPCEPKHVLFKRLHQHAGSSVRDTVLTLSRSEGSDSRSFFMDLLELYRSVQDAELDESLLNALQDGAIVEDRIWEVARFLLGRDRERAVACCTSILDSASQLPGDAASTITSALLDDQSSATWSVALSFLREHPDLARATLGKYASRGQGRAGAGDSDPSGVKDTQIGEFVAILFEHYPPESDPVRDRVLFETEVDSAVFLRGRLIGVLGARKTESALTALKALEANLGEKYPWLRRPRSSVERAYRRSNWKPIPPCAVAQLLLSNDKRLVRSEADAVEGIVAAIQLFEDSLRHESPPSLEDLWNTPTGLPPTPKSEERISDKLCGAVRRYFEDRAVTADREVQIRRRFVPTSYGGEPGSRTDIKVSIPAQGGETGAPIVVPIEVKRSDNPEAKTTGLPEQLFGRYMSELGTDVGVFVVVWLTAPTLSTHSPVWSSIQDARGHLENQVEAIRDSSDGVQIKAIVVDASLT